MKILVCIKQVPASNKVQVDPVTGVLIRNGVESKMNPYDLYAVETALRIREQMGGEVTVITMGPPQAKAVIKEAFAMGADNGVLMSDRRFGGADVLATSYTLAQGVRKLGGFDIIICGKQTTDGDTAQVGAEMSEWLGIPCIANVCAIDSIDGECITAKMDMLTDIETVAVKYPCLVSVDKDIFMPRLPSYIKKKASSDREITVLTLDDLDDASPARYGLSGSPTKVQRIFPPENDVHQETWTGDKDELTSKLFGKLAEMKFI